MSKIEWDRAYVVLIGLIAIPILYALGIIH
jgi:hypothetical protein